MCVKRRCPRLPRGCPCASRRSSLRSWMARRTETSACARTSAWIRSSKVVVSRRFELGLLRCSPSLEGQQAHGTDGGIPLPPVAEPSTDTQRPTGATRTQCVTELTTVQSAASFGTCVLVAILFSNLPRRPAPRGNRDESRGKAGQSRRSHEAGRGGRTAGNRPISRVHARDHETALALEGKLMVRFNAVRRQNRERGISDAE